MVDLTLFELHVHDGMEFSPRGMLGPAGDEVAEIFDDEAADDESTADADESSGVSPRQALLAALGATLVVGVGAVLVKKFTDRPDVEIDVEAVDVVD
jgi:uncharacterized OsmC-like protein